MGRSAAATIKFRYNSGSTNATTSLQIVSSLRKFLSSPWAMTRFKTMKWEVNLRHYKDPKIKFTCEAANEQVYILRVQNTFALSKCSMRKQGYPRQSTGALHERSTCISPPNPWLLGRNTHTVSRRGSQRPSKQLLLRPQFHEHYGLRASRLSSIPMAQRITGVPFVMSKLLGLVTEAFVEGFSHQEDVFFL